MKSCFGYVRVSTVKQGEGVSLEAQKEAIERFASQNDISISKWFEEKETAAKSGRPVFNRMFNELLRGGAESVAMHKIDRASRNPRDWIKVGDLADAGIDVHFVTESLDFRSRGGRLAADIQAVIAADYVRNLKEEVAKGVQGQLKQGLYPLKAPLGYINNGGGKVKTPDPLRADLVKQAFELYASGEHSLLSLVEHINKAGLRTTNNRPLSKACLSRLLTNPFYCGIIRIKTTGEVYQGIHEPIISAKLFDAAQTVRAGKSFKKVTKHLHLFRGLFRCEGCGRAMTGEKQKRYTYYRCHTSDCPTTTVRAEQIDSAIQNSLKSANLDQSSSAWLVENMENWLRNRQQQPDCRSIELAHCNLNQRLENLTDSLIERLIDKDVFNQRKQKILHEQAELREKQRNLRSTQATPYRIEKFFELVKSLAATYIFLNPTEKRELVRIATSNRGVIGRNVQLEPSKWLSVVRDSLAVSYCAQSRPTSRRQPAMSDEHIEKLIELANSPEAQKLAEICSKANSKRDHLQ